LWKVRLGRVRLWRVGLVARAVTEFPHRGVAENGSAREALQGIF